jgi:hypothetical protein
VTVWSRAVFQLLLGARGEDCAWMVIYILTNNIYRRNNTHRTWRGCDRWPQWLGEASLAEVKEQVRDRPVLRLLANYVGLEKVLDFGIVKEDIRPNGLQGKGRCMTQWCPRAPQPVVGSSNEWFGIRST